MESLIKDIRYGSRSLLKRPGFTAIAVVTLALGIGANTAIFSVVNAVLLRPLPFAEPNQLVTLWNADAEKGVVFPFSWPDFTDYQMQSQSFEKLAAFDDRDFTLTGGGDALRLHGAMITSDLLPILGVSPQLGRAFSAHEDKPGVHAVILSHGLWQRRFNSDTQVIGRAVTINNQSFSVVGVMPEGFTFPIRSEPVELWTNAGIDGEGSEPWMSQRDNHVIQVIGRLKEGVNTAQAQAESERLGATIAARFPATKRGLKVRLIPLLERLVGDVRLALLLLFAAVGCVLLIACANVASLSLVRANARQREFAIRAALGATRQQIARELLIESVMLALSGGLIGLLLAVWSTRLLLNFVPRGLPRIDETTLDARVFGFALGVALLTGVLFGLAPAFRAGRTDLTEALREGSLGAGDGKRRNRFRSSLVVAQTAVSLVLLVCAGLLVGSFWRLQRVDPGFDAKKIITLRISLPDTRYDESQVENFYERLLSRVETLPGVTSASAGSAPPLTKLNSELAFAIEGAPAESQGHYPVSFYRVIRPNYFRTLNIPLLQGRDFEVRDTADSTPVVIVNESLVRKYFPHENPLGRRINPGLKTSDRGRQWREIIGVVKDVRHATLTEESGAELYVPHSQKQWGTLTLVARTSSDPVSIVNGVRSEVAALDKDLPIYSVETLEEYVSASLAQQRFQTLLLTLFATVALILTAVGLYGVVSYSVAQRTRELGIRVALGARATDVLKLVAKGGMMLVLIGVAIGLAAAVALTRLLKTLLFGVTPTDAATFATVSAGLIVVALLACYIPARRATKVDPLVALRYE